MSVSAVSRTFLDRFGRFGRFSNVFAPIDTQLKMDTKAMDTQPIDTLTLYTVVQLY